MNILFVLAQIGVDQISTFASNPSVEKTSSNTWDNPAILIFVVVVINLLLVVVKYFLDRSKGKKENKHYRTRKITELSITKEAELFEKLERMSLRIKGEEHELLDDISEVEDCMSKNRIFYSKKIFHHAISIMDYYKRINSDLTKKDIKKEEELLDEYHKLYYDQ